MKKIFKIILVLILIVLIVLVYNKYSGGYVSDVINDFAIDKTATTQQKTTVKIDNTKYDVSPINLYDKLSDKEKKMYDTICQGLLNHKDVILLGNAAENDTVFKVINIVLCEHPEIFYTAEKYSVDSLGRLKFDYEYDKQETEQLSQQIKNKANEIIEKIDEDADDYEKSLYIYDYLSDNVYYDDDALSNLEQERDVSTLVGPLLQGRAICSGYAKAYQYLLNLVNVESTFVFGVADTPSFSGEHAWVVQQVNGEYYYTDPTWGDSFDGDDNVKLCSHSYFCITTAQLNKTHTMDEIFDFPTFSATQDNYFVREGLSFETYDKSQIRKAVKKCIDSGNYNIELKFTNEAAYNMAVSNLIKDSQIYSVLKEADLFSLAVDTNSLSYSQDDNQYVLSLMLKSK